MGKITIRTFLLGLALLLLPFTEAAAAGLGKLTALSALGQPFHAEIEIVSLQKGEGEKLTARLASQQLFSDAGIEFSPSLLSLKLAVERLDSGRYVVVLRSVQPINDPFLDMLVELTWSGGRLVREYTILLDPPEYKMQPPPAAPPAEPVAPPESRPLPIEAPKQTEAVEQPAVEQPQDGAQPEAQPEAKQPEESSQTPKDEKSSGEEPQPGATYEVKRGDTLAKIANANKAEGVTTQQMLVALYRGNKDAFDGDNINRLRTGKILSIPDKETAAVVDPKDARRLVVAQGQDFNDYRRKLGAAVAEAPEKPDSARQSSGGKITTATEDKPPVAKDVKDQLKLSKAGDVKPGGKPAADDLIAKDKALKEANERVSELEKNVNEMQKALDFANKTMADLQKQAQAKPAAPAPAPTPAPAPAPAVVPAPQPAPVAVAPKVEEPKAEAAKAVAPPPPPVAATPAPAAPAAPEAAKPSTPAPAKADAAKPPVAAAPAAPSFLDELLDNPTMLIAAGGVFVFLVGYGAYAWNKKRKSQFGNSIMSSAPLDSSSVFGISGGRNVDTGSSSQFQSDFSQAGISAIDTDEVDPIAEADVYMAYGRDAQAEEILKEALQKDPSRHAVHAKLLEIYATRKDSRAFETAASELYAATGGHGPEWEKAVALGMTVDPGNPLFGGKGAAGGAAPAMSAAAMAAAMVPDISLDAAPEEHAAAGLDIDLDLGSEPAPGALQPDIGLDTTIAPAADAPIDLGFDLSLDAGEAKPAEEQSDFSPQGTLIIDSAAAPVPEAPAAPASDGGGLDFNFELPAAAAAPEPEQTTQTSDGGIDFDLNMGGDVPAEAPKAPEMDLSSISLDLGAPGDAAAPTGDAHWQEVATKLDLAKAYEDMGDKDGARDLLKEVLREGDNAQQQQAKAILEALG